jgi:thiol:disulfide interchange protein
LLFVDNQVVRARVYTFAVSEAWVFCLYIHFLQFIVTPPWILIFLMLFFWVRGLSFFGLRELCCCYRSTGVLLQKWQQENQALLFNFSYYLQACEGGRGEREAE